MFFREDFYFWRRRQGRNASLAEAEEQKNPKFKFLVLLVLFGAVIAGYFTIKMASALIGFSHLSEKSVARIAKWEIKERNEKFYIKAYYFFEVRGNAWQGNAELTHFHLNEASAIEFLRNKSKDTWIVWFDPKNPAKSNLERFFPLNLVIRTIICYGVLFCLVRSFRE